MWRFGTAFCRTLKKSQWLCCSRQNVRIYDLICSNFLRSYLYGTKFAFQKDLSSVWYWYLGLKVVQIILGLLSVPHTNYLNFNLNSLIFLEHSHQQFNLDWIFKIWTDPRFVQNPIQKNSILINRLELVIYVKAQRGSTFYWKNLLKNILKTSNIYSILN